MHTHGDGFQVGRRRRACANATQDVQPAPRSAPLFYTDLHSARMARSGAHSRGRQRGIQPNPKTSEGKINERGDDGRQRNGGGTTPTMADGGAARSNYVDRGSQRREPLACCKKKVTNTNSP